MNSYSTNLVTIIAMYESGHNPQDLLQSIFKDGFTAKYDLPNNPSQYFTQKQTQIDFLMAKGAAVTQLKLSTGDITCLTADSLIYLVELGLPATSLYHYYFWRTFVRDTQLIKDEAMKIANYITKHNIGVPLSYLYAAFKAKAPSEVINLLLTQATGLDQVIDFSALNEEILELDLLSSNLDALKFYNTDIEKLLKREFGEGAIFFHYVVKANYLPYIETIVSNSNFNVNALNQSGQNALFFAESQEITQSLIKSGADTSISDIKGNSWMDLPSLEMINFLINNRYLTKVNAKVISYNHLIRGNFEHAIKVLKVMDINIGKPLDLLIAAIENAIANSTENNKFHAITNLIAKAGISIHPQHQRLINSVDDEISEEEFTFVIGLIPRLAEHYLNLVRSNIADLELFAAAMNLLDSDFATEVLTINGEVPTIIANDLTTFRGFRADVGQDDIDTWFQYGIRAFSTGKYQKFLGFYSNKPWNENDGKWSYGGTYVTLDLGTAVHYALGGTTNTHAENILIEIKAAKGEPQICGHIQDMLELVPANIIGANIIAVYKINKVFENGEEQVRVLEAYVNPLSLAYIPKYQKGDQIILKNESKTLYDSLGCFPNSNGTSAMNKYKNYDDFRNNYTNEQYAADQSFIWDKFFASRDLYNPLLPFGMVLEDICDSAIYCC